jgi:hypothetical protein
MHLNSGEVVQYSLDLFAPGGIDLHVVRALAAQGPAQVSALAVEEGGGTARRRARRAR